MEGPVAQQIKEHVEADLKTTSLRQLFAEDGERFDKFRLLFEGPENRKLLLDYSKNIVTQKTLDLLVALAEASNLKEWTEKMFRGDRINSTEDRAVWHVKLRDNDLFDLFFFLLPFVLTRLLKVRRSRPSRN